jgi:hypothetical protein
MAILGWLVIVALSLYTLWGAWGIMVCSVGFTGRLHFMAVVWFIVSLALMYCAYRFAPFHVSFS